MNSQQRLQQLLQALVSDSEDRKQLQDAIADVANANESDSHLSGVFSPAIHADEKSSKDSSAAVEGAEVDLGRALRCGFPEVVYAEGKPGDLIVRVFQQQQQDDQACLATRISQDQATAVLSAFPSAIHNSIARTIRLTAPGKTCSSADQDDSVSGKEPIVAVVTAGSCDRPVALEAMETLIWMNVPVALVEDVGVAGPQRLLNHVPRLQSMHSIVCVAGMEAALPSVLGGHVACPIVGVPTSVGYGASFSGVAALLSMLNSCASNVVTVNIDAGFRGGYVAGMIASRNQKASGNQKNAAE